MATINSFEQGEDIFRSVVLSIENVITDTANFTTIAVKVFHKTSKVEIGSYTVAAGTITTPAPTTNGVITFIISRTENINVKTGIYSYEVETSEVDVDYSGGTRTRKFIGDCFNLIFGND